ncbi:T9SS type A sorting domain-containing protein [Adhaeribacter radiodurans]|uniref:T9SS type A sorting domain-containing protein n=1 Tax=Adhaeribacter radiodurans TaxID=2745197 RepID=A0A7L7L9K4_9BACT|nr:T9SS type A sorting domain-containing protein [Adhaeribacter radiodurans]QMU29532.1 T9SS type A sorting domain-containing protein [Adhaeribacter radiodurans]
MRILLHHFYLLFRVRTKTYWKQRYSLFILLAFPVAASAQNIQWDKTLGGNLKENLSITLPTEDGGFILGGSSNTRKNGDKSQINRGPANTFDIWLVKLNPNGSIAWDRTLGGDKNEGVLSLLQTKDGGYLVLGYSNSGISGDKTQEGERWLVKLNPDGTIAWDKAFPDGLWKILQQTSDGGYLINGYTTTGPTYRENEYWLVKLSAAGSEISRKIIYKRTTPQDSSNANLWFTLMPDGGYVVGGYTNPPLNGFKPFRVWLVRFKADLTKQWERSIPVAVNDGLPSLQPTKDGGLVLAGYAHVGPGPYKSEPSRGGQDFWLIKLRNDGTQEWNKTLGGSGNDELNDIYPTKDGGYLLGGNSSSNSTGDKTQNKLGAFDYWVVKVNEKGQKIWDLTLGGGNADYLTSVLQSQNGSYFVSGYSISEKSGNKTEASKGGYDYWVVKLDNTERQKQIITFESVPTINYATQKIVNLQANASSGLPVSYTLVSGPATLKNNKLTLTGGSGIVTVKAAQSGNNNFFPAQEVFARILVNVPPVTRIWDKAYGGIITEYPTQFGDCDKIFGASTIAAMVNTPGGGYLLGGTSESKKGNDKSEDHRGSISSAQCYRDQQTISDYWIVKTDSNGKKLWDKTFGGNDRDELSALITTPDGGYLLGGSSRSDGNGNKTEASRGYEDYWIVKTDATGKKQWDKTFGGNNGDNLTSLVATPDGGYLVGGYSRSPISGDKTQGGTGSEEFWIIKIDSNGNKVWDKIFDSAGTDSSILTSMLALSDGSFILGGSSNPRPGGQGFYDYWVVKIDAAGNKLWDKVFGGDNYDFLKVMLPSQDGGYLLGGYSTSGKTGDKTEESKGLDDYWLVKIDANGNKLWDKTFGGNKEDRLSAMINTPDGGILLSGNSLSGISGDKSEAFKGEDDHWLIKLDASGKKLWDRTIGTYNSNYDYVDHPSVLLATPDNSYLVGGSSLVGINGDKSEPLKGYRDYWVVKIKEESAPEALAWDMRYGGASYDQLTSVIQTSDGGYLSGGYTYSGSSGNKTQDTQGKIDYWIVKSDKNGKKLWDKRYGGTFDDFLNRVIQTKDGGYLLAGSSRSDKNGDKSEISRDTGYDYFKKRDFWLVKVDALGNKQWDKTLGGSGLDELQKVIQLSSGEYVLAGHSNSPVSGDKSQGTQGGYDYWLVKISATGSKIWDKRYGGTGNETLGSFTQTQDGGFLLGGTSSSGRNLDKSEISRGKSDYWIVRTDKDGNKLWDKTFGGNGEDNLASLGRGNGGDFFLAGTSSSPKSGEKSQPGYLDELGNVTSSYWIIKIDAQGNKVWDKTFGSKQGAGLQASTRTNDGGYVLAGISSSDKGGDKTENGKGNRDYWVVKLDANGTIQWDKTIGGTERDDLRTVLQTNDEGLLLGGSSNSPVSGDKTQPSQGFSDYWLVKLAPETSSLVAAREATQTEEPVSLTNPLTAYPNPFQGQITVKFSLPETQTVAVKIYDSQGQEVGTLFQGQAKANQTYQVEWQANQKPAGLYFIQLQTPSLHQQQKLLLTK